MGYGSLSYKGLVMTPDEFWSILHDVQDPQPIFYRLYHDDAGQPIVYSMEDLPGNYIEIDSATYNRSNYHVRVVDGKLIDVPRTASVIKLRPGASTGVCCHPWSVCVVVDQSHEHIKWCK